MPTVTASSSVSSRSCTRGAFGLVYFGGASAKNESNRSACLMKPMKKYSYPSAVTASSGAHSTSILRNCPARVAVRCVPEGLLQVHLQGERR